MERLAHQDLDTILGLQLLIAWAGESPGGGHSRLGWWRSDAVDADAGGDLFKRLLPRTHLWAGLCVARRAATAVDEKLRHGTAEPDKLLTLFHLGFELDEALEERLGQHRHSAKPPQQVMTSLELLTGSFDRGALRNSVAGADGEFKITPLGRQLKRIGSEGPLSRSQRLAAALLADPPAAKYPLAHVLVD